MEYNVGDVVEDHRGNIKTIKEYKDDWNGKEIWWTVGGATGLRFYDIKRVLGEDEVKHLKEYDDLANEEEKELSDRIKQLEIATKSLTELRKSLHKQMMEVRSLKRIDQ